MIFDQIYIMAFDFKSIVVPGIYCFLPNKEKETYERLFQLLKNYAINNGLNLNPEFISVDFESGVKPAIESSFDSVISGCLFHLNQCLFRHLASLGLSTLYNTNESFLIHMRMINSLQLLPLSMIDDAFNEVSTILRSKFQDLPEIEKINQILSYYHNTWLREGCTFPKELWNKFRVYKRTNNDLEGINNKFNSCISQNSPNIFIVIQCIQDIQNDYQMKIDEYERNGFINKTSNKVYDEINRKLDGLWGKLEDDEITIIEFLKATQYYLSKSSK